MTMNPADYPPNWPDISHRVRFDRAEGRCECTGECRTGRHMHWIQDQILHGTMVRRCPAMHGAMVDARLRSRDLASVTIVVLTTAHLDQDPSSDDETRMKAFCQSCHFGYDRQPEQAALRARIKLLASGHGRELGEAGAGADERQDPAGPA